MKLARLQQFTTFLLVLAALGWAAGAWRAGHPGWALAGALLIVSGYALVLALEFCLLSLAHAAGDPAPRARPAELVLAWIGESTTAPRVFCWRQPFRSRRFPDHLPVQSHGRRGLLMLHGFVCNRGLWNGWLARLRQKGIPCVAVDLEPVFGSIDAYVPIIEAAVRRLEAATGMPPVLVGHSMGGLAIRRWWAEQADAGRVHHVITIGSPHHGTWLARFAFSRNGREMRRDSRWLQALAQREGDGRTARMTCFFGNCDNIVFPPSTATMPGADNRHIPGVAHVHLVDRPEPFDEALRQLV